MSGAARLRNWGWGLEAQVCAFVCGVTGDQADFGNCRTIAVVRDGVLIGGIVLHGWQPERGTIEISAAATDRRWCSRDMLRALGEYVFGLAGCQMAYARTDERNAAARRFFKALGATEILIPRMRGRTASEALMCLTAEAWAENRLARTT